MHELRPHQDHSSLRMRRARACHHHRRHLWINSHYLPMNFQDTLPLHLLPSDRHMSCLRHFSTTVMVFSGRDFPTRISRQFTTTTKSYRTHRLPRRYRTVCYVSFEIPFYLFICTLFACIILYIWHFVCISYILIKAYILHKSSLK